MKKFRLAPGLTLIETIIGLGLLGIFMTAIYASYSSLLVTFSNSQLRSIATEVLNQQIETIRNIPYQNLGIVGGVPTGIIPQTQTVTSSDVAFIVTTYVKNMDDPFDGVAGGAPNDTAPADYKLVQITLTCPSCQYFAPITMTTTAAPKTLELASNNGSLFINVLNASGAPVSAATVKVINTQVNPNINITDITTVNGMYQLVDTPTSTEAYQISVSKNGYSSEQTYPPGAPSNPSPIYPHATVASQQVTQLSFIIDQNSQLTVNTQTDTCAAVPNTTFTLTSSKLIGADPDIPKFTTTTLTNASGTYDFPVIEWDDYYFNLDNSQKNLIGRIPIEPVGIDPNTNNSISLIADPSISTSLLVTVVDDIDNTPINDASINLNKSGFDKTLYAGRKTIDITDWPTYDQQTGGIATSSGSLKLAGPPYPTSTEHWLISSTINTGSSTTNFFNFSWTPVGQPAQTTAKFQVAANNNQSTWDFVGPDGTSGTYFTAPGPMPSSINNNRYFRYKVYLASTNQNSTPSIDDISIGFRSVCVPPGQAFFKNLNTGTYDITIDAAGYQQATDTIPIVSGWQEYTMPMILP